MKKKIKYCIDCGIEVSSISKGRCSKCAPKFYHGGKNNINWNGGKIKCSCAQCNKKLERNPSHIHDLNFCSKECWHDWMSENTKGDKRYNWKGGVHSLKGTIRRLRNYEQWRTGVFERDGYKCQECGETGYLHAHHIKTFDSILQEYGIDNLADAMEIKELWDINNGITYCEECHMVLHKKLREAI